MRFLAITLFTFMAVALVVFALNNVGTTVPVTLLRSHPDVSLWIVVAVAYALGAVGVGVAAVAEGANTRLANLRLRRELHKLEIEVNYLRTQPSGTGEPAPATGVASEPPAGSASRGQAQDLASAPVYGPRPGDEDPADDETYTGGRAV